MALFADVLKELKKPFDPKDVEWRIQKKSKDGTKGMAMAYIDARAIANRLDELTERNLIDGWSVDYRPIDMGIVKRQRRGFDTEEPIKGFICSITLYTGGEKYTREDGANLTDFEAFKGGLSGAFKRAASAWGIGRYLYDLPVTWAPIDNWGNVISKPNLPLWALPEGYVQPQEQETDNARMDDTVVTSSFDDLSKSIDDDNPFTEDNGVPSAEDIVFPFGKHKAKRLGDVPKEYLQWCLSNMNRLDPKLKIAMQTVVNR